MKRKWMSCIAAAVLLMMTGSNAAIAAPKYQWRIASEEIAGSVADMYAHEFARLLKEKSKGAIQLDVYPSGTLGSPTEMFELTLNGAVEFCLTGPGQSGSIVPENQIFGLHFLFSDNQKVNDTFLATSKAINEQLNAIYEKKGLSVLAYFNEGAMYWTANKPIRKPDDFKGVKFRVMPSELLVAAYKAYGANPTPLSFNELYSALQLKTVEGQENAPYIVQEMKFMEVQKYLIASRHNIYVMQNLANLKFLKGLPEDIRKIVLDSVEELRPYILKVQDDLNKQRLDMMIKAFKPGQELVELTAEERAAFREIAKKADDTYFQLSRNPEFAKKLLAQFRQEMAALEASAK